MRVCALSISSVFATSNDLSPCTRRYPALVSSSANHAGVSMLNLLQKVCCDRVSLVVFGVGDTLRLDPLSKNCRHVGPLGSDFEPRGEMHRLPQE